MRYPTPPELVLLYNAKRGILVFGGAKIVPDVSTSHQSRPPETSGKPPENIRKTSGKPQENLRKTSGKPPENLRILLDGDPSGWGSPLLPFDRAPPTCVGVNLCFELGCSTDGPSPPHCSTLT